MGREDTAPRILNLDNNYTAAVTFTYQSFLTFVTGVVNKKRGGGEKGGKGKKENKFM